jgi:hypothetical protein
VGNSEPRHYEYVKAYKEKQSPEWKAEYNRRNEFSRTKSFIKNKSRYDELLEIKEILDRELEERKDEL